MKSAIRVLLVSLIACPLLAQGVIVEKCPMVNGVQPALSVIMQDTDIKFVEQEWKDYMKNYGKVVKVKGSKESVVPDIHVGDMGGGNLIDVYSLAEQAPDGIKMTVWFDLGDNFLDAEHTGYPRAQKFMEGFAHKVKVDLVAIDLENQHKKLDKFQADYEKLQKENASLHKLIEDTKAKIVQAELDIETNLKDQEVAKSEVDKQKAVVESVQDNPDELKAQQKVLSKYESTYAKLQKDNTSLHKLITDSNEKIAQAERDIQTNLEEQEAAKTMIAEQLTVIDSVQKKLDGLKTKKTEPEKQSAVEEKKEHRI